MLFASLHTIAAQRGEGLRPELVQLLERSKVDAEFERVLLWPQQSLGTMAWYSAADPNYDIAVTEC